MREYGDRQPVTGIEVEVTLGVFVEAGLIPSTPSKRSIDAWRSAPAKVMWWMVWDGVCAWLRPTPRRLRVAIRHRPSVALRSMPSEQESSIAKIRPEAALAGLLALAVKDLDVDGSDDRKTEVVLSDVGLTNEEIALLTGKKAPAIRMSIARHRQRAK